MRLPTFILLVYSVVFISCTTTRYNRQEVYLKEISRYNLNNGDTLVDIGCETGFHDYQIAHYYPDLFFVLEDIDANNLEQIKKNNANKCNIMEIANAIKVFCLMLKKIFLLQRGLAKKLAKLSPAPTMLLSNVISTFKNCII